MSEYDKQQWQEQQAAQDYALDKQREREAKTRERSASNAKRKIARLKATLAEIGKLTEWEEEFSESVTERLDEFGSAFADLEKGRPGDALSFAQKRVVASLNKKVKDARKAAKAKAMGLDKGEGGDQNDEPETPTYKSRSSFKSKRPKFTPRVRNIEDDFEDEPETQSPPPRQPFVPRFTTDMTGAAPAQKVVPIKEAPQEEHRPPVGRPFLRVVSSG